ncbi:MAG: hypothetical protein GY713_19950 [Actinomycetia bacterium]|nr:hypothetical protein [Actinomycetes bacterium]
MEQNPDDEETVEHRHMLHRLFSRAASRDLVGRNADLDELIDHSLGFVELLPDDSAFAGRGIDLGSGGGVPGLVVALLTPSSTWELVDSQAVRVDWLDHAVVDLGIGGRVEAVHARAEVLGRRSEWRESADVATARLFGPPAVVAEIGAGLVRIGGSIIVSDRRGSDRWDDAVLGELALERCSSPPGFVVLKKTAALASQFPRREGVPSRRPLF